MIAVNDGVLLRNHIAVILKQHFRGKPYYVDLLELFNEVRLFMHKEASELTLYNAEQFSFFLFGFVFTGGISDCLWTNDRFDYHTFWRERFIKILVAYVRRPSRVL